MPEKRKVLITGAGGGVGTSLVEDLLDRGDFDIVCQYRNHESELRALYESRGLKFEDRCFKADLTDEEAVKNLRSATGSVWGVINLAGASSNSMSWKLTVDAFNGIMAANVLTTFLTCREYTPGLRESGGRIINTSSVVAFTGAVGAAHYCAAKAAIVGYSKALAQELASKNVTVNTLVLGYFEYGLINHIPAAIQEDIKSKTLTKRFGKGSEIGGLVTYLLGDDGAFMTGQEHHVNGGFRL